VPNNRRDLSRQHADRLVSKVAKTKPATTTMQAAPCLRCSPTGSTTIPPSSRFEFILALRFSTALLAATLATSGLAAAVPPYDGIWSVSIVTEQGVCKNRKYSIHIKNSELSNGGDTPVVISGTVTGHGSLSVAIVHGNNSASGSGQLSARNGHGKWKAAYCWGHWTAERGP
jgi:hypothetical protein